MNIIGHTEQQKFLEKIITHESFAHAYLVHGKERVGKTTLLSWFCSKLYDKDIDLHSSTQSIPDIYKVAPEEGKKIITIKQMRDLIGQLQLTSFSGGYRVAVIFDAHLMNPAASNALLKMLEEPGQKTLLFLVTSQPDQMLATIRSRCVSLFVPTVPAQTLENYVNSVEHNYTPSEIQTLVRYAQGRPGVVVNNLQNKEEFDTIQRNVGELIEMLGSPLHERFIFAEKHADDKEAILTLTEVLRDVLSLQQNVPEAVVHYAHLGQLQALSDRLSKKIIPNVLDKLLIIPQLQKHNVNMRLYLENIFSHI